MSELVKRYTASVFFDQRLWDADITGSLAHAKMLAAQKIIGAEDLAAIERGMAQIRAEIESGAFEWKLELEDVHLNIEARLTQLVGDAGKRLHTGRSRNDQVATDVRLWLRGEIDEIGVLLIEHHMPVVMGICERITVLDHGAHIGIAHDGDADRVLLCDETGKLIDGDDIMAIAGLEMLADLQRRALPAV